MSKVSRDLALKDVDQWLNYKKVSEDKRERLSDFTERIIGSIMSGNLVLDQGSHNWIFKPYDPVKNNDGEVTVEEFVFKPRIRVRELHPYLSNVKQGDGDGRMLAYVCALTKQSTNVSGALYTEDYEICEAIAAFFVS